MNFLLFETTWDILMLACSYFGIFLVALVQAIRFRSYMRRIFHVAAALLGSIRCTYCTLVAVNFLPAYDGLWDYRQRVWQVVLMQMPILLLLFMFSLVFFFWYTCIPLILLPLCCFE